MELYSIYYRRGVSLLHLLLGVLFRYVLTCAHGGNLFLVLDSGAVTNAAIQLYRESEVEDATGNNSGGEG